jgi:hypothetical protein
MNAAVYMIPLYAFIVRAGKLLPFMVHVGSFVVLTQLAKPIANMPSGIVAEGDK